MYRYVSFLASDACLSYVPEVVAKTESSSDPLPRSFLVNSHSDFAAGLEEESLLCPVRALIIYLSRTMSLRCTNLIPYSCNLWLKLLADHSLKQSLET